MELTIESLTVFKKLFTTIIILLILNIIGIVIKFYFNNFYLNQFFEFFDFDTEDSIPTVFSFLLFLAIAFCLFAIYKVNHQSNLRNHWMILAIIFLFLSLDEIISIHENLIPLLYSFEFTGIFYFSWIIPYSLALILFLIYYLKFLYRIPRKTAIYFCLSGFIFVVGAIGVEAFEGKHYEFNGRDLIFSIFYTIEEFMEMLGLSLFLSSLIRYRFESSVIRLFNFKLNKL